MKQSKIIKLVLLLVLSVIEIAGFGQENFLCQGKYWTEDQGNLMMKKFASEWNSLDSWEKRADVIRKAGVGTVIRYYGQTKAKRLEPIEAAALVAQGLSVAVVYEDNGGSGGRISDFSTSRGQADAARAMQYAAAISQPKGSAIYFAVDWDFVKATELAAIRDAARAGLPRSVRPAPGQAWRLSRQNRRSSQQAV